MTMNSIIQLIETFMPFNTLVFQSIEKNICRKYHYKIILPNYGLTKDLSIKIKKLNYDELRKSKFFKYDITYFFVF